MLQFLCHYTQIYVQFWGQHTIITYITNYSIWVKSGGYFCGIFLTYVHGFGLFEPFRRSRCKSDALSLSTDSLEWRQSVRKSFLSQNNGYAAFFFKQAHTLIFNQFFAVLKDRERIFELEAVLVLLLFLRKSSIIDVVNCTI